MIHLTRALSATTSHRIRISPKRSVSGARRAAAGPGGTTDAPSTLKAHPARFSPRIWSAWGHVDWGSNQEPVRERWRCRAAPRTLPRLSWHVRQGLAQEEAPLRRGQAAPRPPPPRLPRPFHHISTMNYVGSRAARGVSCIVSVARAGAAAVVCVSPPGVSWIVSGARTGEGEGACAEAISRAGPEAVVCAGAGLVVSRAAPGVL